MVVIGKPLCEMLPMSTQHLFYGKNKKNISEFFLIQVYEVFFINILGLQIPHHNTLDKQNIFLNYYLNENICIYTVV